MSALLMWQLTVFNGGQLVVVTLQVCGDYSFVASKDSSVKQQAARVIMLEARSQQQY